MHVEESLPVGWTLFYISASDGDAGYFGQINFSVLKENSNSVGTLCLPPQQLFTIEDLTGAVITTQKYVFQNCLVQKVSYFAKVEFSSLSCSKTVTQRLQYAHVFFRSA